jgi:predicted CXXCH cytochrome family protein
MKINITRAMFGLAAAAGLLFLGLASAQAGTMSGICSKCHTMHNSQDGTHMTVGTTKAQGYLLRVTGCIGCHSGPNVASAVNATWSAPVVAHNGGTAPTHTTSTEAGVSGKTLAGGDFYWVDVMGWDNRGHNVSDLTTEDQPLGNTPPGNGGVALGAQINCESCHTAGAHHYNVGGDYSSGTSAWTDGSSAGASYRFLSGGIQGGEDSNWEYTFSSSDHNAYYAEGGNAEAQTDTIQYFCADCHGDFHGAYAADDTGAGGGSPWYRHPTDWGLAEASTTEYQGYLTYTVATPVGTDDSTNFNAGTMTDPQDANDDKVVCMSCHRAHGSPYADMLRWTYDMDSGSGGSGGCFNCHTTKN